MPLAQEAARILDDGGTTHGDKNGDAHAVLSAFDHLGRRPGGARPSRLGRRGNRQGRPQGRRDRRRPLRPPGLRPREDGGADGRPGRREPPARPRPRPRRRLAPARPQGHRRQGPERPRDRREGARQPAPLPSGPRQCGRDRGLRGPRRPGPDDGRGEPRRRARRRHLRPQGRPLDEDRQASPPRDGRLDAPGPRAGRQPRVGRPRRRLPGGPALAGRHADELQPLGRLPRVGHRRRPVLHPEHHRVREPRARLLLEAQDGGVRLGPRRLQRPPALEGQLRDDQRRQSPQLPQHRRPGDRRQAGICL